MNQLTQEEFLSIIVIARNDFSTQFSLFKEFEETIELTIYPDTISFKKVNLSLFE